MRFFILSLLFLNFYKAHATNYYFSASSGDDARSASQAQNAVSPWKSLAKLNSVFSTINPGDSILFKRGDVFEGSIIITKSGISNRPIIFAAYGNGVKPLISGFSTLSNWVSVGNGIYETTPASSLTTLNVLLINGQPRAIGRYPNSNAPNKGYLNFESQVGNVQITDSGLPSVPNWTGGEVVIRKNRWVVDRNLISLHAGNVINYISGSPYSADAGFGYFIQNHPKTLDRDGEWYFNASQKKLGVFFGSAAPASQSTKASTKNTLVTLNGQNNIVLSDLCFEGSNDNAFEIINSQQIRISNCEILFSGANAVNALNSTAVIVENTRIYFTNNNALNFGNCSNTVIKNNAITCTGIFAGMGKGNSGSYEAIMIDGNNNVIELNKIDSTGYIPITFSGNEVIIKNNVINTFAFVKDDGGGIYTWNGYTTPKTNYGRKITGNIILNGLGAPEGTSNTNSFPVNGIYLDDKVNNVEVSNNTVSNCGKYGLFIHNANDITINKNTLFDNSQQLGMVHDKIAPNNPIKNIILSGNILFSKDAGAAVAEYKTIKNDLKYFGNFDSNYYCRPFDDYLTINTAFVNNGVNFNKAISLDGWKAGFGKDKVSKKTPLAFVAFKINKLIGSNKFINGTFSSSISGLYCWSAAGNSTVSWNNGTLDSGALQVSFSKITGTSNRASVIIGVGTLTAGKAYVLKFSLKGTDDYKSLQVFLRKSLAGYNDLSERKNIAISSSRTENEIVFIATSTETNASIVFDIEQQDKPLYLDNIQLHEADVSALDPGSLIRFEYNASSTSKKIILDKTYIDVKSKIYTGSLTLAPFSSIILLVKDTITTVSPVCTAAGTILYERWDNVDGNTVRDIPVDKTAQQTAQLSILETVSSGDRYGARMRGYICAPETGNYTFFIAGDDAAELWLSSDDEPGNKTKMASLLSWTNTRQWDKFSTQQSKPVLLTKGNRYYIEVLHKEGSGGDHVSVAWQLPGGSLEAPIPGSRLAPYLIISIIKSSQVISFAPLTSRTYGDAPFDLMATASSGLPVKFSVISGSATISGKTITFNAAGTVVIEAAQPGDTSYNAAISIRQSFMVMPAPVSAGCAATGAILLEQWTNVAGNTIKEIPLQNIPNISGEIKLMEINNMGDNYATRMRGYICAPKTGNYIFDVSGDDAVELWLSKDDDPAHKIKIASLVSWTNFRQWNKFPSQVASPINLKAGQFYYIEVLHKEGKGDAHVSVGWTLPDSTRQLPIPGVHLSPFNYNLFSAKNSPVKLKNTGNASFGEAAKSSLVIYPNPFKNFATIKYNPDVSGEIRLDILNLEGQTLKQIYKGPVVAGRVKSFNINNDYLPAGVYFIKLVSVTKSLTQKLVVGN